MLWEFFFKYPAVIFERGRLMWAAPVPQWVPLLAAAALMAVAAWSYLRVRGRVPRRDRLVLLALRSAAFAVLAFCLLRPTLLVPSAVPQENYLAVLIDDSRSMQIADREGEPRNAFVRQAFATENSELLRELSRNFRIRYFRFSEDAERIESLDGLTFSGGRSYLGRALDRARQDLASVPLSGLVLVSDGADNSEAALAESLLGLRASSIPVFTVGVGREAYERDIEVSRVSTPRSVLLGSSLFVDVVISQTGFAGETVQLVAEDEGRIVDVRDVELPRDGTPAVVRARLVAEEPGVRNFRFRVQAREGERVLQNNEQAVPITVRDRPEKILYFEGEPRFEVKFMRRAVADDGQVQLVVLQRTAENKFLRLDVDSASELESGFPRTREELFSYKGLVLGSVEASHFSSDQLRMIADFVSERGGGLLMLGGQHAFAEGGWAGTPVADVLPVVLDAGPVDTTFYAEMQVQPTRAGLTHAATQIGEDPEASEARWATLPPLSTYNRVRGVKAGATTLLTGSGPDLPGGQPVLAFQRFGAGQSIALLVQDSWMWQMHADVPLDDLTHERLWRQLLRWLVNDTPGSLQLNATAGRAAPGETVPLVARVRDAAYRAVNDADVVARVESPSGEVRELPLAWSVEQEGEYRGSFAPAESGVHRVVLSAMRGGEALGLDTLHLTAGDGEEEFFSAQMRTPLLRRIAEETGGNFYTAANLANLPADINHNGRGVTVVEEREIWDMPIVFLLLVCLMAAEWGYRRHRGLA